METPESGNILENDFEIDPALIGILKSAEGLRESRRPRRPRTEPVKEKTPEPPSIYEKSGSFLVELEGILAGSVSL